MNQSITEDKQIISTFVDPINRSKLQTHKKTIEVWDWLVENDLHPADFSHGVVTMRSYGFKKLAARVNNVVSVMETRNYRISAVWIEGVEVSFTELKEKDRWNIRENWESLE
jgi:hypothetical protein